MVDKEEELDITFLPEKVVVKAKSGDELHRIALSAGLHVDAACGGNGTCGKCRVRILKGQFQTKPSGKLSSELKSRGYVLSCLTTPLSDLEVELEPSDLDKILIEEGISTRPIVGVKAEGAKVIDISSVDLKPRVREIHLSVEEPILNRTISDLERVHRSIDVNNPDLNMRIPNHLFGHLVGLLRASNWELRAFYDEPTGQVFAFLPENDKANPLGLAVDIGTTTIVAYLIDLKSGELLSVSSNYNRQIEAGDDVISRIVFSIKNDGLQILQDLAVGTINDLVMSVTRKAKMDPSDIALMTVAGNSTMMHIFLGISPKYIREEPYVTFANSFPPFYSGDINLKNIPNALVVPLPGVASYLGADITAGIVATGMHKEEEITLFMDLGTNGELVIGNNEWMVGCSCSAGPAFEGGGVSCGVRASAGAIGGVKIRSADCEPEVSVIGNVKPKGICGSGMIDLLGELYLSGIIDRRGKFYPDLKCSRLNKNGSFLEYIISKSGETMSGEEIKITEVDIDNLIRAKAAVYAGIMTLLDEVDLSPHEIDRIYIAGGFGNYINIENAISIGLLPDTPADKFTFLGNTSIMGAYVSLLNYDKQMECEEVARNITYIELSTNFKFMNRYIASLFLPHTNIEEFPSVTRILSGKRRDG
ncbi:MAG: ASKHA domain-containing protein [Actinobacteria bacterium]|nr:ASKHA domain-containing protein [Actinomycetota bacterium]